jgi:hypothetical protein
MFGSNKGKVTGWWRKLHNESFVIYVLSQILIGLSNVPIQSEWQRPLWGPNN